MAFCTHCGTELPADARFCPACGKPAGTSAETASALPPMNSAPDVADPHPITNPEPVLQGAHRRAGRSGAGLILPLVVVAALLIIGFMLWSQRDGARSITDEKRDAAAVQAPGGKTVTANEEDGDDASTAPADGTGETRTTVASLDAAFRDDPQGARTRYAGTVTVTGTVAAVTLGGTPSLSLEGRSPFNYVVANVADGSQITGAAKGGRITLACDRVTALAGTTILQGCVRD